MEIRALTRKADGRVRDLLDDEGDGIGIGTSHEEESDSAGMESDMEMHAKGDSTAEAPPSESVATRSRDKVS
jgi:hypothetical protein